MRAFTTNAQLEFTMFIVTLIAVLGFLSGWYASSRGRSPAWGIVGALAFLPTMLVLSMIENRAYKQHELDMHG
jgi:uncharacterized membrane protein (DUF485 family)